MNHGEWRAYVRLIADHRCKTKHSEHYDEAVKFREQVLETVADPGDIAPPCEDCVRETESELESEQNRVRELTPEESEAIRIRHVSLYPAT